MSFTERGLWVGDTFDERGELILNGLTERGEVVFLDASSLDPIQDYFDRDDSFTGLGNLVTGQTWEWVSGNFGISSQECYAYDMSSSVVVEAGTNNGKVSIAPTYVMPEDFAGLIFRYTDVNNHWLALVNEFGVLSVQRKQGGTLNEEYSGSTIFVNGNTLSVDLSGSSIKVYVNTELQTEITNTFNVNATKHGIYCDKISTTFDSFEILPTAAGGDTGTMYPVNLNDSVTISETLSKKFSVVIIDTVPITDGESDKTSKTFNDSVTSSDSISSTKGKAVNLSDSVVITESIRKAVSKLEVDSVTVVETDSEAVIKAFADSLTVSDSITATKGKAVILSDSVTITDSIRKAVGKLEADSVTVSDSITKRINVTVKLFDVALINDSMQVFLPNIPSIVRVVEITGQIQAVIELKGEIIINQQEPVSLQGDATIKPAELRGEVE